MHIQNILKTSILAAALLSFGSTTAMAGLVTLGFDVNTTALVGLGQSTLVFQLVDGSGVGNSDNTVNLSSFNFFGGSAVVGTDTEAGGATGTLTSGVTLTNSSNFINLFAQNFIPGTQLSFIATFTNNPNTPFNDMFTASLLDPSGNGIPTLDPSGNDTFITVTLDGTAQPVASGANSPPVGVFGTDPSQTSLVIPAPDVVPEPGSMMLLFVGGLAGIGLQRLRRRQ